LQCWKLGANAAQRGEIIPIALDRVEIGDIKRRKRIDLEQSAYDSDCIAGWRKGRVQRLVRRAIAHPGADNLAAHEVNDRDGLQG
jgi:hypothetical protein